jgi:hypothetical protein
MVRFLSSQRFLAAYSGVLLMTVHRINIVKPDGTIRMVLTNKANAPGAYIKNKEYAHPNRKSAGLLFFDDEGPRTAD